MVGAFDPSLAPNVSVPVLQEIEPGNTSTNLPENVIRSIIFSNTLLWHIMAMFLSA